MREYQVRICERLGVKFPGPTRQSRPNWVVRAMSGLPPVATGSRTLRHGSFVPTRDVATLRANDGWMIRKGLVRGSILGAKTKGPPFPEAQWAHHL